MTGTDGPSAPDAAALVDALPGLVWHCDLEGRCTFVNARWPHYTGEPVEALLGAGWLSCLDTADVAAINQALAAAVREGRNDVRFACRVRRHDGALRWFETNAACTTDAAGQPARWSLVALDVEDTRAAAEADRRERARLETLAQMWQRAFDQVGVAIAVGDPEGRFAAVNPAFARERGYTVDELVGRSSQVTLDEASMPAVRAMLARNLGHHVQESMQRRKDGTSFPALADVTSVHDEHGAVIARVGVFQDITKQKEAERYVAGSPAVIFALRVGAGSLEFLWASDNLKALTGFAPAETDSAWWLERLHPHDAARVLALHTPPYDHDHLVVEYQFRHRDGHYIWLRDEKRLQRDEAGRALEVIGSWVDVTARVELEQQFRQAQKMEAVGRLAGGVAHDFNNLLTIIQGYGELLAHDTPPIEDVGPLAQEICMAATRAAGLTRQLLTFSRKQVLDVRVVGLHTVVAGVEKLLRRLIGEDVELVTALDPTTPAVLVDVGQMEQVVINLAVNARDAMPTGGRITIATGTFEVTDGDARMPPDHRPGRYARLTVTDTGRGMTADVKTRIFEPFYTTKEPGKGTGLGLPIVFGVVKQVDGYIDVWSEPGQGARFTIDLPVADPGRVAAASATVDVTDSTGTETVLLVEDEDRVRGIARLALESRGYRVLEASSGDEGLALARQEPFDLLLTDVVMPGMSGPDLVTRLRQERGDLKVIFMSGYTDDALSRYRVTEQQTPLLQKPFTPRTLSKKVRDVLDGVAV